MAKFASVTADLLVRNSSSASSSAPQSKSPLTWKQTENTPQRHPKTPPDPARPRRLFVPLSHDEHERLFIAAAKMNATPHQIVHAALEDYFKKLAADAQCQCIAGVCTRGCAAH